MSTTTNKQSIRKKSDSQLRLKAALFDQLVELIEDSYLGQLMSQTEKEQNIPLVRAKKQLAR